jgi:hypothetical protein
MVSYYPGETHSAEDRGANYRALLVEMLTHHAAWREQLIEHHLNNFRGYWLWLLGCRLGLVFFMGRGIFGMAALQVAYAVLNDLALLRLRAVTRKP